MVSILFLLMFLLCALGFEIWAAMGLSAVLYLLIRGDVPLNVMAMSMSPLDKEFMRHLCDLVIDVHKSLLRKYCRVMPCMIS